MAGKAQWTSVAITDSSQVCATKCWLGFGSIANKCDQFCAFFGDWHTNWVSRPLNRSITVKFWADFLKILNWNIASR